MFKLQVKLQRSKDFMTSCAKKNLLTEFFFGSTEAAWIDPISQYRNWVVAWLDLYQGWWNLGVQCLVLLLALPKIGGGWPPLWPYGKWNLHLFWWYQGIYKCGQPPPWLSNKFENFKFSLWKIQILCQKKFCAQFSWNLRLGIFVA